MSGADKYESIKRLQSTELDDNKAIKVVVVGDGAVGKTCLCTVYTQKIFPTSYNPTVFDTYPTDMVLADEDKTVVKVNIWDTAGQEEFENLRTLTYPDTDLFIVCFSMVERSSFDNVKHLWLKDLNGRAAKTPKFLVGTKKDLVGKEDNTTRQASGRKDEPLPTQNEIDKLVKAEGLIGFQAVSAKEDINSVSEAFELATLRTLKGYEPKGGSCFDGCFDGLKSMCSRT
jgi:small GTP-binding protein